MTPMVFVLCALWALAAAGVGWYCADVGRQITYVTLADGRRAERRLPLMFRLVLPLSPNLRPLLERAGMERLRDRTGRRIVSAGFEGLLNEDEFLSFYVLLPCVFGPVWIFVTWACMAALPASFLHRMQNFLYIVGPLWLLAYPGMWLGRALRERHLSIRKSLPFVLDLLTLSVEAGMDFMSALQRNVERRKIDALGEELLRVVRQIQLGKTRREALRDMSHRVDLSDLRSVVNALVQADELGVSIGAILRIQSDQIRQRRFERAEKLANEAPVKMLFPLMFFIFPSVFLILMGPIVVRLLAQGF